MEPAGARRVFDGAFIAVDVEEWTGPGRTREIVRHPGAVAVVALDPSGRVILVRQIREAIRSHLLELPAGVRDIADEHPADTGRRELLEETGYRAGELASLGTIHTSPGFSDERIELFSCRAEAVSEPEEGIEVILMDMADALEAVEGGRMTDAKTVAGLLLAARRG